jgi:hypothetical protein
MSVLIQQINWRWNCLAGTPFPDSPCFWGGGGLLQIAVGLFNTLRLTALVNLVFASALWVALAGAENFPPELAVFGGNSVRIQSHFLLLLAAALVVGHAIDGTVISSKKNYQSAGDQMNNNYGETPRGSLMRQVVLFTTGPGVVFHTAIPDGVPVSIRIGRGWAWMCATISVALTGRSCGDSLDPS